MTQTVRALIPVPIGKNSLFAPAEKGHGALVVFVHGFRGKALSTWLEFPDFMDTFDELRQADLLFYGYASRPQRAQIMAINLREHMEEIWTNHDSLGPVTAQVLDSRPISPGWSSILFVAHSLGAVVTRRALLDCFIDKENEKPGVHWSTIAKLCLFAPAHKGAKVVQLVSETFSTLGVPVAPIIKILFPCLHDLEDGSNALSALQDDFNDLSESNKELVRAARVILAENDMVVEPDRFPGDPSPKRLVDRGHINVCKPKKDFMDPIKIVSGVMSGP